MTTKGPDIDYKIGIVGPQYEAVYRPSGTPLTTTTVDDWLIPHDRGIGIYELCQR